MSFRILGLSPTLFRDYFSMSDDQLESAGAMRVIADDPRMPCRVSLDNARLGDEVLLINFEHQPGDTPYRARHAIYVSRSADKAFDEVDIVPETILSRLVAVRAFDAPVLAGSTTTVNDGLHEHEVDTVLQHRMQC